MIKVNFQTFICLKINKFLKIHRSLCRKQKPLDSSAKLSHFVRLSLRLLLLSLWAVGAIPQPNELECGAEDWHRKKKRIITLNETWHLYSTTHSISVFIRVWLETNHTISPAITFKYSNSKIVLPKNLIESFHQSTYTYEPHTTFSDTWIAWKFAYPFHQACLSMKNTNMFRAMTFSPYTPCQHLQY